MQTVCGSKPWLDSYPDWLPETISPPAISVLDAFLNTAASIPEVPCVHYFDHSLTFGEIRWMALRLSAALTRLGVAPGDRVMVVMQNIPQAAIICLAVWMRQAVVVPLNPMYTDRDLVKYLQDCGAGMIVCQDDLYASKVAPAVAAHGDLPVITTSPLDLLGDPASGIPRQLAGTGKLAGLGTHDLMRLIDTAEDTDVVPLRPAPEDLAYLVYTSGTTGPAKGAHIRHANIIHNTFVYEQACRLDRRDVVLGVAPFFHITGIVAHLAVSFVLGIPVVMTCRFDVADTLRLIQKYRVTFTVAAITVYIALLNYAGPQKYDLTSFTKAYSGGAPVSPGTARKFFDALNLKIYNVYGLTESCSPATITPLGLDGPVDPASGAFSVGLVVPGHEAWIVDLEDPGREVPVGAEGELVLRGPGITDGYWQKPEETANAIRGGRFFTGDVAKFDGDGWCYIVDRKKDLINASGYKVWPREVEDMLNQHPAVREAAVVGVPDEYRGETVKAFVAVGDDYRDRITPEELIRFCKERLAAYKYPRILEIIDEVPKTLTGKFLRRELRDN